MLIKIKYKRSCWHGAKIRWVGDQGTEAMGEAQEWKQRWKRKHGAKVVKG